VPSRHLRVGTRGSPMALSQTAFVRDHLVAAHPELAAKGAVEIVTIRTTGDRVQDRLLAEIDGKGLFVKEIEQALTAGHIDLAVHSLKDLETWLPAGLAITCVLPRDDPRDAFLSTKAASLAALPKGARIGTASLRRQAQLLRRRPDLTILPSRGNVNTRIRKLASGEIDALVLALCGLERLGKAELATEILAREIMLPAVGQGALALECRAADEALQQLLEPIHDPRSAACVSAERAMLAALARRHRFRASRCGCKRNHRRAGHAGILALPRPDRAGGDRSAT
jgi:hydroxymethylbilane synthase